MIAILIHVGQTRNNRTGGGCCPIFSGGTFRFVPVAVHPPRPRPDSTFQNLGLAEFVPPQLHDYPAFRSPEFDTYTYSHIPRPGEGAAYERLSKEKGFLVFFSTLYYWDSRPPEHQWISDIKGAYVVGYFKVEGIYEDKDLQSNLSLPRRFEGNGQFGRTKTPGKKYLWMSGVKEHSLLLPKAVPLTEPKDPLKWNEVARRNLFTTSGKPIANYSKACYNWTLLCPGLNLLALFEWIRRFNPDIKVEINSVG